MNLLTQYKGLRRENYILFFGRIVTNLGSMIWPIMTLLLNQKMGMSAANVALLFIIVGAVEMPLSLLGGKWADKYNKKKIIVLLDLFSVILFILCGLVPLSYYTIAFLFLASLFQSMEYPSYTSLIADITKTEDRERAYSLSYLGANIGLVASPTIAGLLFQNYLWLSFIISGVAIGMSTLLIFLFVTDITPVEEENSEANKYQESDEKASVWSIIGSNKVLLIYMFMMALYFAGYNQYGYLMPIDLARVHGDSGATIFGSVSSLNCIIVVIFTPIITSFLKNLCYTKKNVISIFLILIGYVIFIVGLGKIPIYYLAITLFTWGEIISTITSGPYITERIPASHRGRVTSVMGVLQAVVQGVVMYTTGVVYDMCGSNAAWSEVFIALVIALIMSFLLVKEDRRVYHELYVKKDE